MGRMWGMGWSGFPTYRMRSWAGGFRENSNPVIRSNCIAYERITLECDLCTTPLFIVAHSALTVTNMSVMKVTGNV